MIKLISPRTVLKLISYWPPYLLAGIRVVDVNADITSITVRLTTRWFNQNYVGTHFGGSLYAMTDPFYMFILLHHLKREHIVWDISAEIEFIKASAKPVTATFSISKTKIDAIAKEALETFKVLPIFETTICEADGTVVAKVKKGLYVRRKDAKTRFAKSSQ